MQVGYEKNCDFLPIARFISETVQDKAVVSLLSNANTNSYRRTYAICRTVPAHFQWLWMTLTQMSRSCYYLTLNIPETVRNRDILQWNNYRDVYVPHSKVSFSNDLEWPNEIFNNTKRRAASLRQLMFLKTGTSPYSWLYPIHEAGSWP